HPADSPLEPASISASAAIADLLAEQVDTEEALDRGQHHRQVVIKREYRLRLDVDPVTREHLVVGVRLTALGDGDPVHREDLVAAGAARRRPGNPDSFPGRHRGQPINRADGIQYRFVSGDRLTIHTFPETGAVGDYIVDLTVEPCNIHGHFRF